VKYPAPENTVEPAPEQEIDIDGLLPVEVEVYIDPDGAVTFADLEASLVSLAEELGADRLFASGDQG
jgi:hypothetical protein